MIPQLLVSVRNRQEAVNALAGGAQIIDVKEPSKGPLGMADVPTMIDVAEATLRWNQANRTAVSTSFALGEIGDWEDKDHQESRSAALEDHRNLVNAFGEGRLAGVLLKVGTSRAGGEHVRSNVFPESLLPYVASLENPVANWIAVAYADYTRCQGICPLKLAERAVTSPGCVGLLIDTFVKDGQGLLRFMSQEALHAIRNITSTANLRLALAGQIHTCDLPALCGIAPDVIGIRGAACDSGDRKSAISQIRVRDFLEALAATRWSRHREDAQSNVSGHQ
ncbi:MAG: hypothetical protein KDA91_14080 [Planctomycetaceae bacterium]|nr:hypothetical protein [Planctomycetaceae bacterium]